MPPQLKTKQLATYQVGTLSPLSTMCLPGLSDLVTALEVINSEHRISHGMANPLLESFRESPKACVTNSHLPLANFEGKENPDLPLVCSNYQPPNMALSMCFNHLVLLTFQQCRSAISQRSAKSITQQRNPQFNVIKHCCQLYSFILWKFCSEPALGVFI